MTFTSNVKGSSLLQRRSWGDAMNCKDIRSSKNFSTIPDKNPSSYRVSRIKSCGDFSRTATEPKGRGANLRKKGYGLMANPP